MQIFELLKINKGTVSSALGKELAAKVLNGDIDILPEAIELCSFDAKNKKAKNIHSGAAKIVEIVAEKKPELVAPHLEKLIPALSVAEPQTRWMTIRIMGFCSEENIQVAEKAIKYAKEFIEDKKDGLCLASSADLFLGDYGSISKEHANQIFPILEKSISNVIKNEPDWILEAFFKIFKNLNDSQKEIALSYARLHEESERKTTVKRVEKLIKLSLKK